MGNILTYVAMFLGKIIKKLVNLNSSKMVIVIRSDLSMGRGKIASQSAHAAILLYEASLNNGNPYLKSWLSFGQPKIVLKADTEATLLKIYNKAKKENLTVCKVYDAGRTQVSIGTLTTVGIGPNESKDIDNITGELKLL